MSAQPPDDDPHGDFRNLCMLYGDFNRGVFLEEILNFIAGFGATAAELSAIRSAVQKRAKQMAKRPQRGRHRTAMPGSRRRSPPRSASVCWDGAGAA
jgi:hypothetical protein